MEGDRGVIRFTHHAVARYVERLRPALDTRCAARELQCLTRHATLSDQPPAWYVGAQPADGFLVLGDVALVLQRTRSCWLVVTVVSRGSLTAGQRAHRNRAAAARRAARRGRRFKPRHDRRPLTAPEPLQAALGAYA